MQRPSPPASTSQALFQTGLQSAVQSGFQASLFSGFQSGLQPQCATSQPPLFGAAPLFTPHFGAAGLSRGTQGSCATPLFGGNPLPANTTNPLASAILNVPPQNLFNISNTPAGLCVNPSGQLKPALEPQTQIKIAHVAADSMNRARSVEEIRLASYRSRPFTASISTQEAPATPTTQTLATTSQPNLFSMQIPAFGSQGPQPTLFGNSVPGFMAAVTQSNQSAVSQPSVPSTPGPGLMSSPASLPTSSLLFNQYSPQDSLGQIIGQTGGQIVGQTVGQIVGQNVGQTVGQPIGQSVAQFVNTTAQPFTSPHTQAIGFTPLSTSTVPPAIFTASQATEKQADSVPFAGVPQPGTSMQVFCQAAEPTMNRSGPALSLAQQSSLTPASIVKALKDPYGLSWLYPNDDPEEIIKRHTTAPRRLQPDRLNSMLVKKYSPVPTPAKRRAYENLQLEQKIFSKPERRPFPRVPLRELSRPSTFEVFVTCYTPDFIRLMMTVTDFTCAKEIRLSAAKEVGMNEPTGLLYQGRLLGDSESTKSVGIRYRADLTLLQTAPDLSKLVPEEYILKLGCAGYESVPSLVQLARMNSAELSAVHEFTIQNVHGKIIFEGKTNLLNVDIGKTLKISKRKVEVYFDSADRPDIGQGLNKPAIIHLFNCFPAQNKSAESFKVKLQELCKRDGAVFIRWEASTGEWVFRVNHF